MDGGPATRSRTGLGPGAQGSGHERPLCRPSSRLPLSRLNASSSGPGKMRRCSAGEAIVRPWQCEEVRIGGQALSGALDWGPQAVGVIVQAGGLHGCLRLDDQAVVADVLHGLRLAILRPGAPPGAAPADEAAELVELAGRVRDALDWLRSRRELARLPVGLLGAGAGTVAALRVAAERPERVAALVGCGGRPGVALEPLDRVLAPTLLIAGGLDTELIGVHRAALRQLQGRKRLEIVPAATRRFEEPAALDTVAHLAGAWFARHLPGAKGG